MHFFRIIFPVIYFRIFKKNETNIENYIMHKYCSSKQYDTVENRISDIFNNVL
jgi:hypothetical protein